jgi:hypothetical protein
VLAVEGSRRSRVEAGRGQVVRAGSCALALTARTLPAPSSLPSYRARPRSMT